jgi:hypothetical protein
VSSQQFAALKLLQTQRSSLTLIRRPASDPAFAFARSPLFIDRVEVFARKDETLAMPSGRCAGSPRGPIEP